MSTTERDRTPWSSSGPPQTGQQGGHGDLDHPRGAGGLHGPAPVAPVARLRPPGLGLVGGGTAGFDGALGRGGGRSEEAFPGLAFPVAELRLQALVLCEQLIDPPLSLQAALAEGASHGPSGASAGAPRAGAGAVHRRWRTSRPSGYT
jgi:hypothetical protein